MYQKCTSYNLLTDNPISCSKFYHDISNFFHHFWGAYPQFIDLTDLEFTQLTLNAVDHSFSPWQRRGPQLLQCQ